MYESLPVSCVLVFIAPLELTHKLTHLPQGYEIPDNNSSLIALITLCTEAYWMQHPNELNVYDDHVHMAYVSLPKTRVMLFQRIKFRLNINS